MTRTLERLREEVNLVENLAVRLQQAMKLNRTLVLLLSGFLLVASTAAADDVARGRVLYLRNCASCHGVKGDGRGPVAPALKAPPSDLRLLSLRYGNPLPEDQ